MCFHEDARVCVDDVITEILRTVPFTTLEMSGPEFCREMLEGRDSSKPLKGVAREQVKFLARQFYSRWSPIRKVPQEFEPEGSLGVGKGVRSLPITLFRTGAARLLSDLNQGVAEAAIRRAQNASAFRLQGVKERTKREFYKLMQDDLEACCDPIQTSSGDLIEAGPAHAPKTHPVELVDTEGDTFSVEEDDFYIPSFREFAFIFDQYPYIQSVKWKNGVALALGYAARKHLTTDRLIRRNCKVTFPGMRPQTFKDLGSLAGIMKNNEAGVGDRQVVKVVNLVKGTVIKYWTNIGGVGDQEDMYRYLVVFDEMVGTLKSYPSEEMAVMASDALLSKKGAQLPLAVNETPRPRAAVVRTVSTTHRLRLPEDDEE